MRFIIEVEENRASSGHFGSVFVSSCWESAPLPWVKICISQISVGGVQRALGVQGTLVLTD